MKNKIRLIAVIVLTVCAAVYTQKANAQPGVSVSFQGFYDNLSPYGQWVEDPNYGYVWAPNMDPGFRPYYSGGHWVMTDYGNMWVSDYPWGWAPFHYGRWTYDGFYGWVWIPGNEWAPAWVSWRGSPEYYGWAPLGPGISISFTNYHCPDDWWVFIPPANFYRPRFDNKYYGPRNMQTVINNTTIINNTYVNNNVTYNTGPRRNEIEKVTNQPVPVYHVREADKPGVTQINKNEVAVYRPAVVKQSGSVHPVPPKAVKAERPIEKPQPVSVNNGRPARFDKAQPGKNVSQKGTQPVKPVKQQPKQNVQPSMPIKKNKNNAEPVRPVPDKQIAPPEKRNQQMENAPQQEIPKQPKMEGKPRHHEQMNRQRMNSEPRQQQPEPPKREEQRPQMNQQRMNSGPQRQQPEPPRGEEQNPRQMNQQDEQPHSNTAWQRQAQNSQRQFAFRYAERGNLASSPAVA